MRKLFVKPPQNECCLFTQTCLFCWRRVRCLDVVLQEERECVAVDTAHAPDEVLSRTLGLQDAIHLPQCTVMCECV